MLTEAGKRAVSSRTGALAGNVRIWNAFFKQTGVIRVYSLEELIDEVLLFMYLPKVKGRNIGVIGIGGGASVYAADELESRGLFLPTISVDAQKRMKEIVPLAGSSFKNLVDTVEIWDAQGFMGTINLVASEPEIDLLLVHIVIELAGQWKGRSVLEGITKALFTSYKTITKPMAVVLHSFDTPPGLHMLHDIRKKFIAAGIPTFPTISRAAQAISKFIEYHNQETSRRGFRK